MTPKQKLATKANELLIQLKGEDTVKNDPKYSVEYLAENYNLKQLNSMIENFEYSLEKVQENKRINEYYETEAGQLHKAYLESEIKDLETQYKSTIDNLEVDFQELLNGVVGENWTLEISFGISQLWIAIGLKNDDPEKSTTFKFGHDFSIYVTQEWPTEEYKLHLNYGTLGNFDPEEDVKRIEYLVGLGKIASDKRFLTLVKNTSVAAINSCKSIGEHMTALKNELENPLKSIEK